MQTHGTVEHNLHYVDCDLLVGVFLGLRLYLYNIPGSRHIDMYRSVGADDQWLQCGWDDELADRTVYSMQRQPAVLG